MDAATRVAGGAAVAGLRTDRGDLIHREKAPLVQYHCKASCGQVLHH